MEKYKRILSFLPLILTACVSIYLTYLVDITTLNSVLQRIFVFCFFALSVTLLLYLFKRYIGIDLNPKIIAAAAVLSLTLILIFQGSLIPENKESTVTFKAGVGENTGEVWLSEVQIDGVSIPLTELEIVSNEGWTYSSHFDDYVYYPSIGKEGELTAKVYADSLSVAFARNSWSGAVLYSVDGSDYTSVELFSTETYPEPAMLALDLAGSRSPVGIVFSAIGAGATVFIFTYQLLVLICRTLEKKKKKSALTESFVDNILVFSIYFLAVASLVKIFDVVYGFALLDITVIIGFVLLLLTYPYSSRIIHMLRKLRVAELLLLVAVTFIITFQTVSEIMFMSLDKVTVDFIDVVTFIIAMVVVAVPVMEITLLIDKHTQKRFAGGEKNEE